MTPESAVIGPTGGWLEIARHGQTKDEVREALLSTYREMYPNMTGETWLRLTARVEAQLPAIMAAMGNPDGPPTTHLRGEDVRGR